MYILQATVTLQPTSRVPTIRGNQGGSGKFCSDWDGQSFSLDLHIHFFLKPYVYQDFLPPAWESQGIFFKQGVKLSADPRNSAHFCNFLVIPEINVNLRRTVKGYVGPTTWPTEMVHLSKFAEFHKEMHGNLLETVSLWQIMANSLESIYFT